MQNDSVKSKILNFELSFLTLIFAFSIRENLAPQLLILNLQPSPIFSHYPAAPATAPFYALAVLWKLF